MTVFITFAVAGFVTFLLRSSMVLFGARLLDSPRVAPAIALVAPAVLAAIIASALFIDNGHIGVPRPIAAVAIGGGALAVYRTKNVSAALFVGLPIYWLGVAAGLT